MSDNLLAFPGIEPAASAPAAAPDLPTEQHVVAAALAAERLVQAATALRTFLALMPRDAEAIGRQTEITQSELNAFWTGYSAFQAVRSCKGTA